ncbi:MAG: cytochrome c biogenesis protein CcsA [Fibrobacterota bacterium]|nr:cytochrome c biogenesis protein CcsA [Fibrobacterota bacterium]
MNRTISFRALSLAISLTALASAQDKGSKLSVIPDEKFDSLFEASQKMPGNASKGSAAAPGATVDTDDVLPDGHPPLSEAQGKAAPSILPQTGATPPASLADVKALEKVPVLHEGRLKPMITYARHMLLQFSGKTTYEKSSAMQVMARILFTPELAGDNRIFLINNPEVAEALGIAAEKHRRYSFLQLEKSLPKLQELAEKANAVQDEKRDIVQKEVLRVFGNMVEFVNLTRTLSYTLPNPMYTVTLPETKTQLGLSKDESVYSFWDLMTTAQGIARILEGIGNRGEAERTPMEREIIQLSQAMYLNSQALQPSPYRIFPIPAATVAVTGLPTWISPPEIVAVPEQLQSFHKELSAWSAATRAYRAGDQGGFDSGVGEYLAAMDNRAFEQLSQTHFPLEVLYQKGEPFYWSLVAYWLALLGCFGFFLTRKPWLYKASMYIFLTGYAIHVLGIVSRTIIMQRPPVTTLYESFLFVGAISILVALFIERFNKRGIGLLVSSLLGVILLHIANRYATEGDTMRMLVAVLDSNFWLSTHVVTVTIGYSACILAGAIGHVWLIRALVPGGADKPERLKEIAKMIYGTLCFGLLFSFIGTVLGGIWADQSWGRFWGWDPKENGALLIVIWCIIMLHAKHWGYIRNLGIAQGSIFGAIVVALAWFGVNLLNVGLHSYGFTDGASNKLFAYCGGELLFMLVTFVGLKLGWGSGPAKSKDTSSQGIKAT